MPSLVLDETAISSLATAKTQEEFYDAGFKCSGSFGVRVGKWRKSFFVIYSANGKRRRMTLGFHPEVSLFDARKRAEIILERVASGADPRAEMKHSRVLPLYFGAFTAVFLDEYVKRHCTRKTADEYRRIIQRELLPVWEIRRLDSIKRADVGHVLHEIVEGRGKQVMAERVRAVLSKLFSYALERGLTDKNPCKEIKIGRKESERNRILSWDELGGLWGILDNEDWRTSGIFKMLLLTGQRLNDVLRMRWQEIQLEIWTPGGIKIEEVDERYRVHLSPQTVQVLKSLQEQSGTTEEYVFSTGKAKHVKSIGRQLARLCNESVFESPWNAHDIRRTVEVRMRQLGVRPDVIDYTLGRTTSIKRYKKRFPDIDYPSEAKRALLLWNRELVKRVSPTPVSPRPRAKGKVVSLFP